jgi:hemerythrin-like domain-containing protein
MTRMIEILREEHRNIEKLLHVLELELDVFDRRERPDYDTLQAVIDYFKEYPDRCHHPKEDMIFEILKARDPAAAERVGDLAAEHQEEAARLRNLAWTIENVRTGRDMLRQTVVAVVRDFIDHERRHMELEERVFFAAASNVLQSSDWAQIDAHLSDKHDPLFNGSSEQKFRALRQQILQWEQENEDDRLKSIAGAESASAQDRPG